MTTTTIDEVHRFWFGDAPATDRQAFAAKLGRWYMGGEALDREIGVRFRPAVEHALGGGLDDWESTPRGVVALIVLLDQFPRSIFRGQARAFSGAARAERIALAALDGDPAVYGFEELMPLLHAESEAMIARCLAEAQRSVELAPAFAKELLGSTVEQSEKYLDIIRRFGRFPHRNAAHGRASTPEEEAFLVDFMSKAPPRAAAELQQARDEAERRGTMDVSGRTNGR